MPREPRAHVKHTTVSAFVALVVGVVAIVAVVGATLLGPIRELTRIGDEHARAVSVASRLRGHLSELRRGVVQCVEERECLPPPGSAARYRDLGEDASELRAFSDSPAETAALGDLHGALGASAESAAAIEAAARDGDVAAARGGIVRFLTQTGVASDAAERIVNHNAREVRESVAQVRRALLVAIGASSGLAVVVVLAALVLLRYARTSIERYAAVLERHSEEMGAFAARAAHEIRTPLQTLTLAVTALERERGEGRALVAARASVRRLVDTVDAILEFSRSGAAPGRAASADVAAIAAEVVADARRAGDETGVALADEVPPGLAAGISPAHLRVVLANLVGNAIRYGAGVPHARVTISALAAGDRIEIAVTDNGPGIAAESLPRVFDPFFRASARPGGTGLGLATVRQFVEAYSGRVAIDCPPSGGTRVAVELPRAAVSRTAPAVDPV